MAEFKARAYQDVMIDHMIDHPRCAAFVFMGAGKTSSVLATLTRLSLVEDPFPALIVAPLRVARKTWREEIAKWDDFKGLRVSQIVGPAAERTAALKQPAEIYTINYENLPWLVEQLGKGSPFKTIVIDESSKLKNFRGSIQTHPKTGKKFLRCDSGRNTGALAKLAFKASRVIELTGTPAPNGLVNLWAQIWFLDGGARLGRTFNDFVSRWFHPHPSGYGLIPHPRAQAEIQERIKDICLTIDPADWFDLEAPIHSIVKVELDPRARKAYDQMEKTLFLEIEGNEVEAMNAASKTMKCLQLANGAIYTDADGNWSEVHAAKLEALDDIIEEANGMPVLVAYQFQSDLARLLKAFPKGRVLKTEKDEDDFKAGRIPVLFAHPASAGHGIDGFQRATNIIVFFGHWWDLEQRQQIIERIGPVRQLQSGMNRPVFIYDIVAAGTVDELVMVRHETKREVQDILLEALAERSSTSRTKISTSRNICLT